MKILQINKYYHPHLGGIETVVRDINNSGTKLAVDIDVLCFGEEGISRVAHDAKSTIYKSARLTVLLGMPISWDFFRKTKLLIPQYDLVILHHPFPLGFLVYLLYGFNKHMVVWYHSDIVRQNFLAWLLTPLFDRVLQAAQSIVVSDLSIAENSELLKSYSAKVVEIPFAKSMPQEGPVRGKHSGRMQILSVGRLVYYKGYEYLLRAMKELSADLTIVGTGPLLRDLNALILTMSLDNVRIIPPVTDSELEYYYRNCDVFVLPSIEKSEAFGLVQLEAMSHGKPVINTNLPTAVPTVSLDEVSGITVEPKDEMALRVAIQTLIDNPELRHRYGLAARQRVQEVYNHEQFKSKLTTLINEVYKL